MGLSQVTVTLIKENVPWFRLLALLTGLDYVESLTVSQFFLEFSDQLVILGLRDVFGSFSQIKGLSNYFNVIKSVPK